MNRMDRIIPSILLSRPNSSLGCFGLLQSRLWRGSLAAALQGGSPGPAKGGSWGLWNPSVSICVHLRFHASR